MDNNIIKLDEEIDLLCDYEIIFDCDNVVYILVDVGEV
jgi:hypothetical protein